MNWVHLLSILPIYQGSCATPDPYNRGQAIFREPVTRASDPGPSPIDALMLSGQFDAAVQRVLFSFGSVQWLSTSAVNDMFSYLKRTVDGLRVEYRKWFELQRSRKVRPIDREVYECNRDTVRRMIERHGRDAITLARRVIESGDRSVDELVAFYRAGGDFARYIAETAGDSSHYARIARQYYDIAISLAPDSLVALELRNSLGLLLRLSDGVRVAISYLQRAIAEEQESLVVRMATEVTSPEAARRRLEVLDLMRHNVEVWEESADDDWVVV